MNESFIHVELRAKLTSVVEALREVAPIGRQRQRDSMRGWVAELAAGRGRAVLVEGEPGIGKSRLVRAVEQLPLLLVGMARPVPRRDDFSALRRTVPTAGRLRLHSLSDSEVAELVACTVGGVPGPQLLRLAQGAGGNPFYVTELVDAFVRGGALTTEDG